MIHQRTSSGDASSQVNKPRILVIGYQQSVDGVRLHSGQGSPVVVRTVAMAIPGHSSAENTHIFEYGCRIDGHYMPITPSEDNKAALTASALAIPSDPDLEFYEFVPFSEHVPDGAPLEVLSRICIHSGCC